MPIFTKDSGGAWRQANNTLSDGLVVQDSLNINRQIGSAWVNDGISWKQIYQKSPYDTSSTHKKRDMMFVGDSITWGYGLTMTQGWPYLVQQAINRHSGYVSSGWTARNLISDDYTSSPFQGGAASPLKIPAISGVFQANFNPMSHPAVYAPGSGPYPSYTYPGISINTATTGYIGFNVDNSNFPSYIVCIAEGVGTIYCYQRGYSSPIGAPTLSTTPTAYIWNANALSGSGGLDFTIYLNSGSYAHIWSLHPTNGYNDYTNGHINVIVNGRNSYALADYTSATTDIQSTIINTTSTGSASPIYVISCGTVSMYDSYRAVSSPSTYVSQLSTICSGLTSGSNAGTVVLTLPPAPDPSYWTFQASGGTRADYNNAIIGLANSLGCQYVDLYNGPFVDNSGTTYSSMTIGDGCYQADGIHPTALGSQLLANRYICALGLG